jgi:chemosensory pili system protein ChpA (sensor histidine kinase/response regulator)
LPDGHPDHDVLEGEFEALAHQLSGLGFFVDKLQYGPADLDQILNPKSAAPDAAEGSDGASVESELATRRAEAAQLLDRLSHGGADERTRDELRQALETIRQDAKLLADEKLEQRASEALAALKAGEAVPDAAIADAVQGIGQAPLESLAPSADTVRLAEASQEEFDAELLEIFIEEAREVLENMASSTDAARLQPHRQDLLTTLRRGFHTLKGSGRMVGLRDLGEAAFSVEQVMNRWLASERDGTPELFDLLDGARTLFAGWVDQLANGDTRSPDHAWLQPACDAIQITETESTVAEVQAEETADLPTTVEAGEAAPFEADIDFDPDLDPGTLSEVPGVTELVATDLPLDATTGQDIDLELDFDLDEPGAELADGHGAIDLTSEIDAEERALDAGGDRTLFDLFIAEARGHVATLRRELTRLHINPSLRPSQDSMLAAHTLGGISLTVDQGEISALAKALEHALNRCDARGEPPEADQSALLNNAASVLEAQVAAIGDGAAAAPAQDLIAQLDRLFVNMASPSAQTALPVLELPPTRFDLPLEPVAEADATDLEWHEETPPETADERAAASEAIPSDQPEETLAATGLTPEEDDLDLLDVMPDTSGGFEKVTLPDEYMLTPPASNPVRPFELSRTPAVRTSMAADELAALPQVPDDIDLQLLPIFVEEAQDLLRDIGHELRTWRDDPEALSASDSLRRQLHTLKGSARMAGVMRFGDLVHGMETLIEQPCTTDGRSATLDDLEHGYDRCEELVARLERGESLAPEPGVPDASAGVTGARRRHQRAARTPFGAGALRHGRPLRERSRRNEHRAHPDRRRVALAARLAERPDGKRAAPAQPAARDRDSGRKPDAVAHGGRRGAARTVRSARNGPLHALPGTVAHDGRKPVRRDHRAVQPRAQSGRCRYGDPVAGATQPQPVAGAHVGAHGALRDARRPSLPRGAPVGQGNRQEGEPRTEQHADRAGPGSAREDDRSDRAPSAQCGRARHRDARSARSRRQVGNRRDRHFTDAADQ